MSALARKRRQIERAQQGLAVLQIVADEDMIARVLITHGVLDPTMTDSKHHVQAAIVRFFTLHDALLSRVTTGNGEV